MSFLENCFNCYGIVVIISSGSFIFSINKDNSIQLHFCQDCHMSRLIFNKRWMQIFKNSIANKLSLFALCAKELQWNLHNGHYFLPQKTIQTRFNLSMTATSPQWQWPVKFVPNAQITSQCWPVELMTCQIHETLYIWNVKLFGAHVFIPLLLFPQRLIANRNWTVGQPIVFICT